jgi:hypothetical protein
MDCNNPVTLGRVRAMKPFLTIAMMCLLALAPTLRADTLPPEDQYFDIYSLILKGDRLVEKGKTDAARTNYLEAATELKKFQEDFPLWNTKVVKYRIEYLETKLAAPEPTAPANKPRTPGQAGSSAAAAGMMDKSADAGTPVELKLKWQTGKRYAQQMDMTMGTDITIPGQNQTMQQKTTMGMGFTISALKDRDGGGKELEMQGTGLALNVNMGGNSVMSYDSKSPPTDAGANPVAALLQKVGNIHLTMLTDADGKVESIEGFKEFLDSLGGSDAAAGAAAMKGMFSEDSFKQMASIQGLPDHPVKIGDTWPSKTEVSTPAMGTMVTETTYTFTGWEQRDDHKCAVLAFTGNIYTKPGDDAATVSMDDGKTSGEILFDPALGTPVATSTIQSFTMKMSAQGQSMSTKMTQDISVKLASVTDIPQ